MARPPRARERVLDAFEEILLTDGERTATLDATAKRAGVSKGGLLYHFGSKEELAAGLVARMNELVEADIETMHAAEDGPVSYYLRTSIILDDPLARALTAVSRIAQSGSPAAVDALKAVRLRWADSIRPHVRDEASLDLVMLVSDGLYFNNALRHDVDVTLNPSGEGLAAVIDLVRAVTAP
ncbi:TetR/AcrR family transcriptional regulator [Microbacterium sp. NIBRBAC000506063]|uniref:TetR/AcrR family transcriptional regulator n=1 Tax=Microbacterium sp. NIBRBAC000506063 TaxID=2734618 RepID=UPI001BB773AF|nr:TetR/AcrR family transcriptional regulator [Microbacterium sp. NIBRBAC000506063]QTV79620.1 TetR/AcrR family transcriptional regulator [Microbacterium sp. NIBRBAC000506063]